MIYVFGNSHAHPFTASTPSKFGEGENRNEWFRSFSLGPVIAYNFVDHHLPTMKEWLSKLPITAKDGVLLAIGEVDCRWHLPLQASKQNRDPVDIVHECVDRFFPAHLELKRMGYNIIGWGNHPSSTQSHDPIPSDPVFGDCLSRNRITLEWNDHLEKLCGENNIPFVSILRDLINVDGLTKMEYFRDYCHLNPKKTIPLIVDKFKTKGLL